MQPALCIFTQQLGKRFKRLIHPTIQLDFVIQRTENIGDAFLLGKRWKTQGEPLQGNRTLSR